MSHLVLIIEDNEKNMKLARDLLEYKGYRVLGAGNAADGIALAREHQPDLLLLDIQLPGMDGFTALSRLREDPPTAGLTVVAFTASVMSEDVERIRTAGFDGYIAKPIQVAAFADAVAGYCAKKPD